MNFTIIKNSESYTGYEIADKEFKGIIAGLCCGWQFEYKDANGAYHYSSVSYEEVMPEEYAYRWEGYRGSWLLDMLPEDYEFTGRVIFRGYAESYYDAEERDWFVKQVEDDALAAYLPAEEEVAEPVVVSRDDFNKMVGLCRSFDPFTQYIDNYKQMEQAEKYNKECNKEFSAIITKYNADLAGGVPYGLTNCGEKTAEKLLVWLSANGLKVEEDEEKPKHIWKEDEIKRLVQSNDKVLYGALKQLYNCQTMDEKDYAQTTHANGAGFNALDADFLTSVSKFLIKNGFLTEKQKVIVRKKLVKYNKQ